MVPVWSYKFQTRAISPSCHIVTRSILCSFGHELSQLQLTQWTEKINAPVAVRGEMFGGNKLRTYRTFKNEFITKPYLSIIVHKKYKSCSICQA